MYTLPFIKGVHDGKAIGTAEGQEGQPSFIYTS